ncbi:unnamed protein product, partial [Heterosigma akashiwo]
KVRSTLHASALPHSYWSEALFHAVETTNRIPTRGLENYVSPYERWYGHLFSIRHLRAFGSSCFAYEPLERRPGKLSPRGLQHKFLSYGSSTGVYRLLSPHNGIVLSKHVVFNESAIVTGESTTLSPVHVDSSSDSVIPPTPSPSVPASPPPSTRRVPPSVYTGSVPAGVRKKRGVRAGGGFMSPKQTRSLRRQGYGSQPNTLVTRSVLRNLSNAFAFLGTHSDHSSNPWGPTQARRLPNGDSYQQAMLGEMGSMKKNHVSDLVDPPEGANIVTSWVLSKKFDADGKLVKYKARLVAQGFTQRAGVDYHNSTYAPVIAAPSLRLMLSIAANKGYAVDALDISTAFPNGDIDGDVYVEQPPGFVDKDHPHKVWKLRKSLYGLKQSPRIWCT